MDRQEWKVLNAYRNRLMARLEYAFGDGYIDEEQYSTLYDEVTAAASCGGSWRSYVSPRARHGGCEFHGGSSIVIDGAPIGNVDGGVPNDSGASASWWPW